MPCAQIFVCKLSLCILSKMLGRTGKHLLELSGLKSGGLNAFYPGHHILFLFFKHVNYTKLDQIYCRTGQLSQYSWHPYIVIDKEIDVVY